MKKSQCVYWQDEYGRNLQPCRTREEKESCLFSRHYIYMSVNQNAQAMNEMSLNQEGRHHRTNGKSSWEHKSMDVRVKRGQDGLKEA